MAPKLRHVDDEVDDDDDSDCGCTIVGSVAGGDVVSVAVAVAVVSVPTLRRCVRSVSPGEVTSTLMLFESMRKSNHRRSVPVRVCVVDAADSSMSLESALIWSPSLDGHAESSCFATDSGGWSAVKVPPTAPAMLSSSSTALSSSSIASGDAIAAEPVADGTSGAADLLILSPFVDTTVAATVSLIVDMTLVN